MKRIEGGDKKNTEEMWRTTNERNRRKYKEKEKEERGRG